MVNGQRRKVRALNLPKGRASALPKGSVIRTGLRGRKPLARRIINQAKFTQRTGIAPRTIGTVGRRRKRSVDSSILGFRMDGRTL
jgi:hypothetical protein